MKAVQLVAVLAASEASWKPSHASGGRGFERYVLIKEWSTPTLGTANRHMPVVTCCGRESRATSPDWESLSQTIQRHRPVWVRRREDSHCEHFGYACLCIRAAFICSGQTSGHLNNLLL